VSGRQAGGSDAHAPLLRPERVNEPAVLRHAVLGNVHIGQHLEAADHGAVQRLGQFAERFQFAIDDYAEVTNEFLVSHSTAKHTRHHRDAYMVGALARFNVNHARLHPRAQAAAVALRLESICTNPYMNSIAQIVEIVHCLEDAIALIDALLERGIESEPPPAIEVQPGAGVGACEVPRGTLYHHYRIGADGRMAGANCIIPTGQNLANVEADMRALVPRLLDRTQDEIRLALEMLVRAYDPCISCATHMLDVRFE